jgi:hypothetical protein
MLNNFPYQENVMNRNRLLVATAISLVAILTMAGCKNEEPAVIAPQKVATPKAPATMSVIGVDLGNAVGADMKVTMAMTTFGPKDTIIVAVTTATSDPDASVPGKLGAKWSYEDGNVVNEEAREVKFTGKGVTDFRIAKPDGWPVGKYKVEISLDGKVVQSKDFEVK